MLEKKSMEPNFSMQIMFLEPGSPYVQKRGEVLTGNPNHGKQQAGNTLWMLYQALKDADPARVRVSVYDSLPSVFIAEIDDMALLGLCLNTGTALQNPVFEFYTLLDGNLTDLGEMVRRELARVQTLCRDIKLDSVGWDNEDIKFDYMNDTAE